MELWRWADAERELAVAVRVSPNYATARQWYGTLLARLKKGDAAVEQVRIGSEIDPVTPIINEAVGSTFSMCGQPDRAAAAHRRVLEMHPAFATAHMLLGSSLYRLGKLTEAEASLRKALSLRPENCQIRARLAATLFTQHRADAHALAARVVHDAHQGRASFYCAALRRPAAVRERPHGTRSISRMPGARVSWICCWLIRFSRRCARSRGSCRSSTVWVSHPTQPLQPPPQIRWIGGTKELFAPSSPVASWLQSGESAAT